MGGYNPQADAEYLNSLAQEIETLKAGQNTNYPMPSSFNTPQKQNLVEYQLDFRGELEDIEHLLRNDIMQRDPQNGNESWIENPDKTCIVFNRRGTNEILKQIRMFLNKNMVLSNYQPEEIQKRLQSFGHELRALIYNNYEDYGLDTDYKLNHYPMIVICLLAMIESAYRRALYGDERKDLNSMRMVTQTENNGPQQMPMYSPQPQSKRSFLKPWTWLG